jgi:cobalt/nickel transport system permease protein
MTAAFVFAAQMLNFPVGAGTSGHFLGATFAALLLGPWTACLIMSLVLITQCLFFADGGITALGTNIVNLGVVAVFAGWGVSRLLLALLPRSRATSCAAMGLGAWVSVVAAATACSCELGWSGKPLGVILPTMVGIHAIIGVGEALITVAVVSSILGARPDLLPQLSRTADVEAAS